MLLRRAKHIFRTEGLIPLLRRGFAFVAYCFFEDYGTWYLYEIDTSEALKGKIEADFMPKVQNFTFRIVSTNQEADELAADGLEFRADDGIYRGMLDKGAIAFCVFVEQKLVHIVWVTTTEEAKKMVDRHPYKVDFANNEVCVVGAWTNPKYRGKGFIMHGFFKGLQFLKGRGILRSRACISTSSIFSQRAAAKFSPKVYAEGRYLRMLWWKLWKEKPLTPDSRRSRRS